MQRGFLEPGEKPRRFYRQVTTQCVAGGWEVHLDGRTLRTPKGERLALPTGALAQTVAREWEAQGDFILQAEMHATRLANTAAEAIPRAREATAAAVAGYAASDLLCYYAEGPPALVAREEALWTPLLERVEAELGLRFVRVAGIVHQEQPAETLQGVEALALELDDFALAGLAFGSALFGSAILAIAVARGWVDGAQASDLARVDDAFQEEQWGVDEEAAQRTARLRGEAVMLEGWFGALKS